MKNVSPCYTCKCEMWIPDELYAAAKRSENILFYCAYGHEHHYPQGETDEVKFRHENQRLVQRLAQKDDSIKYQRGRAEQAERQASAFKGQVTKIKKRVGNGVCPCCNRTFSDLARHMKGKHPDYSNGHSPSREGV